MLSPPWVRVCCCSSRNVTQRKKKSTAGLKGGRPPRADTGLLRHGRRARAPTTTGPRESWFRGVGREIWSFFSCYKTSDFFFFLFSRQRLDQYQKILIIITRESRTSSCTRIVDIHTQSNRMQWNTNVLLFSLTSGRVN